MVFLSVSSVIRIFIPPCDLVILLYPPRKMSIVFGKFIYMPSFCVEIHETGVKNHQSASFQTIFLCYASFSCEKTAIHIVFACFAAYLSKMSQNDGTFFDFHLRLWYNLFTRKNKRISKRCFLSKAQNICLNWFGCFAQYCVLIPVYCFLVPAWKESCASPENAPFQNAEAVEFSGDWRYFDELSRCVIWEG